MKRLFLLRHAKSDWGDPLIEDFDRPLNKRGKEEALLMGLFLKTYFYIPELIISSPAKRARKTAKRIARQIDYPKKDIIKNEHIYEASAGELLECIRQIRKDYSVVMMVGHNPGLTQFAYFLSGGNLHEEMQPCGLFCVDFDTNEWNNITEDSGKRVFYYYPRHPEIMELEQSL